METVAIVGFTALAALVLLWAVGGPRRLAYDRELRRGALAVQDATLDRLFTWPEVRYVCNTKTLPEVAVCEGAARRGYEWAGYDYVSVPGSVVLIFHRA